MRILFTILLFLLAGSTARAEDPAPLVDVLAPYSNLTLAASGAVDQVIDPRTLRIDDGTIIRLIAIDVPGVASDPPVVTAKQAYDLVAKATLGKAYNFYQMRNQEITSNQYGQLLALAVDRATGESLQDKLLKSGLARVWDGEKTGFDLIPLLQTEDTGRQTSAGIWVEHSSYRTFVPRDIPVTALGQIGVVTGQIQSIMTYDNAIYLNLTNDGMKGFSFRLPPELRPHMARIDFDPFALQGRLVRGRGIVLSNQRAYIDINNLWQLEVLPETLMPQPKDESGVQLNKVDLP